MNGSSVPQQDRQSASEQIAALMDIGNPECRVITDALACEAVGIAVGLEAICESLEAENQQLRNETQAALLQLALRTRQRDEARSERAAIAAVLRGEYPARAVAAITAVWEAVDEVRVDLEFPRKHWHGTLFEAIELVACEGIDADYDGALERVIPVAAALITARLEGRNPQCATCLIEYVSEDCSACTVCLRHGCDDCQSEAVDEGEACDDRC